MRTQGRNLILELNQVQNSGKNLILELNQVQNSGRNLISELNQVQNSGKKSYIGAKPGSELRVEILNQS